MGRRLNNFFGLEIESQLTIMIVLIGTHLNANRILQTSEEVAYLKINLIKRY